MTTQRISRGLHEGIPGLLFKDGEGAFRTGIFPDDFAERLTALKVESGLSWNAFAGALGVDPKQVGRWRKGTAPSAGAMLSLFDLAFSIPGGTDVLRGRPPTHATTRRRWRS